MRNLKKILALVLALVMSLSLMATASASDFADASSITDRYATAVEVLSGLKVFKGYAEDGTFRPQGDITRAEVATIIYRIATGDAEDAQASIYTNMTTSFTDLGEAEWARGYVNYCHNAEIIKGESATKFNPNGKISGYATLAMILRAMGYGRNGEFEGPQWEITTAAKAKEIGLIDNVMDDQLGSNAPRELVAEILFRALLTEMVDYTVLNGYVKNGKTLGKENLGLEGFEGVIVANEYADLNSNQVLADGKTQIQVEGEDKVRTLNYSTKITEVGESRIVYTQNGSKVLYLSDTDENGNPLNTTKEYGEGVKLYANNAGTVSSVKFQEVSGMSYSASGTEFYRNFEQYTSWKSDYRIEYVIGFSEAYDDQGNTAAEYASYAGFNANTGTVDWTADGKVLNRVIPAGYTITPVDYYNMWLIFTWSNGIYGFNNDQTTTGLEIGQVYVATQTKEDISDKISFRTFENDYLTAVESGAWTASRNGQWVKFIDNNGDGTCDYAFLTQYWLDEVVSSYTNKAGDTVMQYFGLDDDDHSNQDPDYTVRYMQDDETIERDVQVGDVVLWADIDNQVLVSKPETVTTQANSYNYKNDEIVAANGETYGQSGIGYYYNITNMQFWLYSMAPKTDYEMFLDKFGFVRGYREPGDTQYALITELYYSNDANGNLLQTWPMTAELTMPDENGNAVTKNYSVAGGNNFVAKNPWTNVNNYTLVAELKNWLQPATAHLGVTWTNMSATVNAPTINANGPKTTFWSSNQQVIPDITAITGDTFNYGKQYYIGTSSPYTGNDVPVDVTASFTNIAVVKTNGDSATITGAARAKLDQYGQPVNGLVKSAGNYAVDYIQLDRTKDVAKGAASYTVANTPAGNAAAYNYVVNADKDTEIYVVFNGGVKYFKGYTNMPKLTNEDNNIHAAYAVARNTNTGTSGNNYWIADVIVYEVQTWEDTTRTSISLAYYTPYQQMQSANGVLVNTLNSKTDPTMVDLIPGGMAWGSTSNWWGNWGSSWKGFGFYHLYNETAPVDGVMSAAKIEYIDDNYGDEGIFVGTVTREVDTAVLGGYIPVNMSGDTNADGSLKTEANISIASGKIFSVTIEDSYTNGTWGSSSNSYYNYTEANALQYNSTQYSQVKANDKIIWVGNGTKATTVNSASFIVDLGSAYVTNGDPKLMNPEIWDKAPTWLKTLWSDIYTDQNADENHENAWEITIKYVDDNGDEIKRDSTNYVTKGSDWHITADELAISGYNIQSVYAKVGAAEAAAITKQYSTYGIDAATLTANTTVTVTYTWVGYSLAVNGDVDATATVTTTDDDGKTVTLSSVDLNSASNAATGNLRENAKFTIKINNPAVGMKYTAVVTNGTVKATSDTTFEGTVEGATSVVISAAATTYTATINKSSDVGVTVTSTDKFTWGVDGKANVTVAITAGYSLVVDSEVEATAADGTAVTAKVTGVNTITLTDTATKGTNVTLTIAAKNIQVASNTVTLKVPAGVTASYIVASEAPTATTGASNVTGEDVTITVPYGQHVYVFVLASDKATVTSAQMGSKNVNLGANNYVGFDFGPITNSTVTINVNVTSSSEGGDQTNPGDGDQTNPGGGDQTNPGDGDQTNPGDGDQTNPGDGDQTNPGDGDQTNPGDGDQG